VRTRQPLFLFDKTNVRRKQMFDEIKCSKKTNVKRKQMFNKNKCSTKLHVRRKQMFDKKFSTKKLFDEKMLDEKNFYEMETDQSHQIFARQKNVDRSRAREIWRHVSMSTSNLPKVEVVVKFA
jgi:hypothetical protein